MKAIFKRELKAYFTSPLIYVIVSVYLVYSMIMFFLYNVIIYHTPELVNLFGNCNFLMHLIIPFITMKLFSEEKTQRTDQLLLTSPNSITSIVMGKFFSAMVITTILSFITVIYAVIVDIVTVFDWPTYFMLLLGTVLMNMALLSIGLFISAVFGNMVVSALVTLGIMLVIYFSGMFTVLSSGSGIAGFLFGLIDLSAKYNDFAIGLLSIESIVYYLSFATVFVFLSVRAIDKKRWS